MKLAREFYEREDVVLVARELLGKTIHTCIDGHYASGRITELEAYAGMGDKACHANNGRKTPRTRIMYGRGGHAYVYLCYGIHHLFNVVTNREGRADAVLLRAIEPLEGIGVMQRRRKKVQLDRSLTAGPGLLSQALGIHTGHHYGSDLLGDTIWIEDAMTVSAAQRVNTTRIGVGYAGEDARKPWRFYIKGSTWVSRY